MRIEKRLRLLYTAAGFALFVAAFFTAAGVVRVAGAAEAESNEIGAMNNARLDQLIQRIDAKAKGRPGFWELIVEERKILVITDESADRMRIISPVTDTKEIDPKTLYRLLQANFDSALDARYSIAKNTLWSAFIHPLSTLGDVEFLKGVGQVVNLVSTYGTTYSSGLLVFKGGDSSAEQRRELIERLLKKGLEI